MKKIILLGLCLTASTFYGQVVGVVEAPLTDKLLAKQVTSSRVRFTEQIAELKKQADLLESAKNSLEKVSNVVSQSQRALRVLNKSDQLFKLMENSVTYLSSANYPNKLKQRPLEILDEILSDLKVFSSDATSVLKNGFFKMNDADRLDFLDKVYQKLSKLETEIQDTMRSARRYASMYNGYKN